MVALLSRIKHALAHDAEISGVRTDLAVVTEIDADDFEDAAHDERVVALFDRAREYVSQHDRAAVAG